MFKIALLSSALLFALLIESISSFNQEYTNDGNSLSDEEPSLEDQQQSQSLQAFLSRLIPSVWAENPIRREPDRSTTTQRPQPAPNSDHQHHYPTSTSQTLKHNNHIASDQKYYATQDLTTTAASASSSHIPSPSTLDSVNYWATGANNEKTTYDIYKEQQLVLQKHQQKHQQSPEALGWQTDSKQVISTNRYTAPQTNQAAGPQRQVISAQSNRFFYPPEPAETVAQSPPAQHPAEQPSLKVQQTQQPPQNVYSHAPYQPQPNSALYWQYWQPQPPQQQQPQQVQSHQNSGGYYQQYPLTRGPAQYPLSQVPISHHNSVSSLQPPRFQQQHPFGNEVSLSSPPHLLSLPPHLFSLDGGSMMQQVTQTPPPPATSSSATKSSGLLATLVNNKAELSNLIKLLPLIAETMAVIPRVLHPSIGSSSNGDNELIAKHSSANQQQQQQQLAQNQRPSPSLTSQSQTTSLDPSSSLGSSLANAAASSMGTQPLALINGIKGIVNLMAAASQQQQQNLDLDAAGTSSATSRWPMQPSGSAAVFGSLLRNAAAMWLPTLMGRAQEVVNATMQSKSRLRTDGVQTSAVNGTAAAPKLGI